MRQHQYYQGNNEFVFGDDPTAEVSVNYVGSMMDSSSPTKLAFVGEPSDVFYVNKDFCDKYDKVITCQYNRKIANKVFLHSPALPWQLGYSYKSSSITTEDFSYNPEIIKNKTKLLSVITSPKAFTSTQLQRVKFVTELKKALGDACDVFGLDSKFDNKDEAILPYKFHVVIENNTTPHMWTEKLADCLLGYSIPIYYGAPNVNEYFNAIDTINIYDVEASIAKIKELLLLENIYQIYWTDFHYVNRNKLLHEYNLFSVIDKAIGEL